MLGLAAFVLYACGSSTPATRATEAATASSLARRQQGLASYYSSSLAGRRTASGEPYRPALLTAAHRKLPFGTIVRVRRLDTGGRPYGPTVVVRINDRGPYSGRRVIDLSLAAARALGMEREGVVPVELEIE